MTPRTDDEKLAKLEAQRKRIEDRMRGIRAKQRERERRDDTRRKILLGAAFLNYIKERPNRRADVMGVVDQFLDRDADRALFDLPPRR